MSLTSPVLGPVLYRVWVNGVLFNSQQAQILDAQLHQQFGHHDRFYLRIEFRPNTKLTTLSIWPENTPIAIQWGRAPYLCFWYGYVNDFQWDTESDSGSGAAQLTYRCIGTSTVLNTAVTRQWEQGSPTWLARRLAQENNFRSITTPISFLLDYEVQVGETYFQFLNRVANYTGMRFWCSSGTLYMLSPTTGLQGTGSGAIPTFVSNKQVQTVDTLRNFRQLSSQNLPGSIQSNRVIYGIDHSTGALFSASKAPLNSTSRISVKTTTSVTSYQDAQNRINAWSALSQFWVGATATVYGDCSIYPGKLVRLEGNALPVNSAGYWLVASVKHNLMNSGTTTPNIDKFLSDVVLLRNTQDSNVILSNVTPITPEYVSMQLNQNGKWVATNQASITVNST